jgi:hypothetical protein
MKGRSVRFSVLMLSRAWRMAVYRLRLVQAQTIRNAAI